MVINLRRHRRKRADERGHVWEIGGYRRDTKWMRTGRVFLNGREVTHDTFYVDTRRGIVRQYLRNAEGNLYLAPGANEPAWSEKRGHVKLTRAKVVRRRLVA